MIAQGLCSEKANAKAWQAGPLPRSGLIELSPIHNIAGWRLSPDQLPNISLDEVMASFRACQRDMPMVLCVACFQDLLGEMV